MEPLLSDWRETCGIYSNFRCKKHVGETVQIGAWVANKRSSGKIAFLQLRDGTAYFQGIVVKPKWAKKFFSLPKI